METDRTDAPPAPAPAQTPTRGAAEAFEDLREEVKRLAARFDEQRSPRDYSETLGTIAQGLSDTAATVGDLAARPALNLTPAEIACQIDQGGAEARSSDRQAVREAVDGLHLTATSLSGWIEQARLANKQNLRLVQAAIAGVIFGALLAISAPILAMRSVPERWVWPERMAAFVMERDRWTAGERLLATADPERWREVQAFREIGRENRETIQRCRDKVERTKRGQSCAIRMTADSLP